jgi:hypothetical protein
MQKRIDAKLDPATAHQNPTPRRIRMANAMREDGYRLQEQQAGLLALAAKHQDFVGIVDLTTHHLDKVRFAKQVETVLNRYSKIEHESTRDTFSRLGIKTDTQLEDAREYLRYLIDEHGTDRPSEEEQELLRLEQNLVGQKIPGFFPTPKPLIDYMLELLEVYAYPRERDLEKGRFLEPSAGKGDIAEAIRERYPEADLDLVEINYTLAKLLELKGFDVTQGDILGCGFGGITFDAIVMNPPFENGQDGEHVRFLFDRLSPGGILISIMGAGIFSRQDNKSKDFRTWLAGLQVGRKMEIKDLDDGSFKKAFRSTGVSTKLLILKKPS